MEKISKVGKNFETVFEEILTENNLTQEEVIYKTTEIKKGLFKSANVEVTIYKKSDIYDFVKEFLKEIVINLGLEVTFETKKVEDRVVIKMYSNNNNILIITPSDYQNWFDEDTRNSIKDLIKFDLYSLNKYVFDKLANMLW